MNQVRRTPPKLGGVARSAGWFRSEPFGTRLWNHPSRDCFAITLPPNLGGQFRLFHKFNSFTLSLTASAESEVRAWIAENY